MLHLKTTHVIMLLKDAVKETVVDKQKNLLPRGARNVGLELLEPI